MVPQPRAGAGASLRGGMLNVLQSLYHGIQQFLYCPLPAMLWPWPLAIPFWAVFLWSRHAERKISVRDADFTPPEDRGSRLLIYYGLKPVRWAAVLAAFLTAPWVEGPERLWLYAAGLVAMIAGA